jgi:hypothetical protein
MRPNLPFLCLALLAASLNARASEVKLVRVWPGWQNADYSERISEFFTGEENTSGQITLRSQPADRAGYYFLTRLDNNGASVTAAQIILEVIAPSSPRVITRTFPTALPAGSHAYQIGLTGADWPDHKAHPVAWRLRVLDAGGRVLAEQKSFLWEAPATP